MKRKTPLVFIIPAVAVMGIIAVAFYMRSSASVPTAVNQVQLPRGFGDTTGGKPTTFLGGLFGGGTSPIPTPTVAPSTAAGLSGELNSTIDDGGQADLNALSKEASGL
ncbi:MAG TPA: hypothetical protein VMR81_01105 [Patescibacteria group bacterium]|nr:hypothetical protein [Patescibacteria group bacterium]